MTEVEDAIQEFVDFAEQNDRDIEDREIEDVVYGMDCRAVHEVLNALYREAQTRNTSVSERICGIADTLAEYIADCDWDDWGDY